MRRQKQAQSSDRKKRRESAVCFCLLFQPHYRLSWHGHILLEATNHYVCRVYIVPSSLFTESLISYLLTGIPTELLCRGTKRVHDRAGRDIHLGCNLTD